MRFQCDVHGRDSPSAPAARRQRRSRTGCAHCRSRPVGLARLHPPQPDHERRAATPDRGRRLARRDFQSVHLRKGGRRQAPTTRSMLEAPEARDAGSEGVVREARRSRYAGRRRFAAPGLRGDCRARRLREPRGLAAACARHRGTLAEARRLWKAVGRDEPDDQGSGHCRKGSPAIRELISRGRQRQRRRCSSRSTPMRKSREAYIAGSSSSRQRRRPDAGGQRRQLFRQPHRHSDRRADRGKPAAERGTGSRRCRARLAAARPAIANAKLAYQRYRSSSAAAAGSALVGARRADPAAVMGEHRHEESGLSRRRSTSKSWSGPIPSTRFRRQRSKRFAITGGRARASRRTSSRPRDDGPARSRPASR